MKLVALAVGLLALPLAPTAHADVTINAEVTVDVRADIHADDANADVHADAAAIATVTTTTPPTPGVVATTIALDNPLLDPHWEASIGMAIPMDLGGPGPGLAASLGRQVGALRISGEYLQLARDSSGPITSPSAIRCLTRAHRLGATARYRVAYGAGIAAFGAYVEGGLGRETYVTKVGPAVARSAVIGLGFESLVGGRSGGAGFDMGYRAVIDVDDGETAHMFTMSMLLGR